MPEVLRTARWPSELVHLLVGTAVLITGLGLAFSYTAPYLTGTAGVGPLGASAYFAANGAGALIASLAAARWLPVEGRRISTVAAVVVSAMAFVMLPSVSSVSMAAGIGACVGISQAVFQAATIPATRRLAAGLNERSVFALRHQIFNIGIALGAGLTAALLAHGHALPSSFLLAAVAHLPVILLIVTLPRGALRPDLSSAASGERSRLSSVPLALVTFHLMMSVLVFSQFETTVPVMLEKLLEMPIELMGLLVGIHIAVLVAGQRAVTRVLSRWAPSVGLVAAVALWVTAYAVGAGTFIVSPQHAMLGLGAMAAILGAGECAFACSFHPALLNSVPPSSATSVASVANGMGAVGSLVGPAFGLLLVGTGSASTVLLVLLALTCVGGTTLLVQVMQQKPTQEAMT